MLEENICVDVPRMDQKKDFLGKKKGKSPVREIRNPRGDEEHKEKE